VDASGWQKQDGNPDSIHRIFGTTSGGTTDAKALTIDGLTLKGRTSFDVAPVIDARAGLTMRSCIVQSNT
jgi:hypothetical protein